MTTRTIRSVMPIRPVPPAPGMVCKTVLRRQQRISSFSGRVSPRETLAGGAGMTDHGFAGRGAVVTGAGAGIGRAIAAAFAQRGGAVVVVDLHPDRVAETVRAIEDGPGTAFAVPGDVRAPEAVARILE